MDNQISRTRGLAAKVSLAGSSAAGLSELGSSGTYRSPASAGLAIQDDFLLKVPACLVHDPFGLLNDHCPVLVRCPTRSSGQRAMGNPARWRA